MGLASNRFLGTSELSALASPASAHTPGLALIKSVKILDPNYTTGVSSNITTLTVDAPLGADFKKYRSILFRFSGVGFVGTATDLTVLARQDGLTVPSTLWYQINQITATTTTGWVNTNTTTTVSVTSGGLVAANVWIDRWDILMTPTGYDCDIRLRNSTTLPTGSIITTTVSYNSSANNLSFAPATSSPGVTIGNTGGTGFIAAQYGSNRFGVGLNCDIYGYTIS